MQGQIEIIALPASDWHVYKEYRLHALSQDPPAFLTTYAESVARPDEVWEARLRSVAEGHDWLFFARIEGEIAGMMGAYRAEDADRTAVIWGVHVDRAYRGQGIAAALMAHLLDALQKAGIERVRLGVAKSQAAAIALYRQFGFAIAGDEPGQTGYFMEKDLSPAAGS